MQIVRLAYDIADIPISEFPNVTEKTLQSYKLS